METSERYDLLQLFCFISIFVILPTSHSSQMASNDINLEHSVANKNC